MVKKWKLDSRIKDFSSTVVAFVKKKRERTKLGTTQMFVSDGKRMFFQGRECGKGKPWQVWHPMPLVATGLDFGGIYGSHGNLELTVSQSRVT